MAYGQRTFLNALATVQSSSAASNRYTYTAREWDATDQRGRVFVIEVQIVVQSSFAKRAVFYACEAYTDELRVGQGYSDLKATYSICLLMRNLWDDDQLHHQLRACPSWTALISLLNAILMLDLPIVDVVIQNPYNDKDFEDDKLTILAIKAIDSSGAIYNIEMQISVCAGLAKDTIEIHLVELPKYTLDRESLAAATPIERWAFLFQNSQLYTAEELRELFPEEAFQLVISSVETIHLKTEYREVYETREKTLRDYDWKINTARDEGIVKGREEGKLIGIIRTCQMILSVPQSSEESLRGKPVSELQSLADDLQSKLRKRVS